MEMEKAEDTWLYEATGYLEEMLRDVKRCNMSLKVINQNTGRTLDLDERLCMPMGSAALDKVLEIIYCGTDNDPRTEIGEFISAGITDYLDHVEGGGNA